MRILGIKFGSILVFMFMITFLLESCLSRVSKIGRRLDLGFQGAQKDFVDNNDNNKGLFLLSNSSNFAFGFNTTTKDTTLFLLVVIHTNTSTVVWSANRDSPVKNSDKFVFDISGNAYLQNDGVVIWSTDTAGKGVAALELLDTGNLVLISNDSSIIWQSFSHPTDALLSNQLFTEGMKLVSNPNSNNLSYSLEIVSGDMILSASFITPQTYWTISKENRRVFYLINAQVTSAIINGSSWYFYQNKTLLWYFEIQNPFYQINDTWVAVLGEDGYIRFKSLLYGWGYYTTIPKDTCDLPFACDPLFICYSDYKCQCPLSLPSCKHGNNASQLCNGDSQNSVELVDVGETLSYFALDYVVPFSKTDLNGCKSSCLGNCSCITMFFDKDSGSCYHFDQTGSLKGTISVGPTYASYVKISSSSKGGQRGGGGYVKKRRGGGGYVRKRNIIIISIVIGTVIIILGLLYGGYRVLKRRNRILNKSPNDSSDEESFCENLSGKPIRFSYKELEHSTDNFNVKLGKGGFGSVYKGTLADGIEVAVKKLEGFGQGSKEFRAEVSIIGSIHHHHLVTLKGFCAQGSHRMLVYEYMANGSLDSWIFKKNQEEFMLDWDRRYNIAVGTAKGLAYLHEECDVKIIHCDIKPENVLIDNHFVAKVSDFGLAKLMTREQSHVFTTLRGTRGYLAPEWIANYAISEKSDVYSYGMVLLEIIGGRKNFDPTETSLKSHFPTYAFKMMEEGRLKDIIDERLKVDENDERIPIAIKVALWCIQDDMHLRPSMTRVVQMLEGVCPVLTPPSCNQLGARLYGTSSLTSISTFVTATLSSVVNDD